MPTFAYYTSAGNFIGSAQGSVDSRTGLFNVSLPLGKVIGNDLMGPSLSLNLMYSPLSTVNHGFGSGFQLNMSTYNLNTGKLSISTGEEYRVAPNGRVRQQKMKNFIFNRIGNNNYQIIHKSGIIEKLSLGAGDIYFPIEITNADGRKLQLTWSSKYFPARLTEIRDDSGFVLCSISYPDDVHSDTCFTYWPNSLNLRHEVNFTFRNDYLVAMVSNALTWSFEYDAIGPNQSYRAIVGVKSPTGLDERVKYYTDNGMGFPEKAGNIPSLPCVHQHELHVGAGRPKSTTRWSYTRNNYLGHGANFNAWHPDEDQMLNRLLFDYEYGSTAEHLDSDGTVLCTETRRYNSYHLLVSETTVRGEKKHSKHTEYYAQVNKELEHQPTQYALPKKHIEKWYGSEIRSETTELEFDEYGNPTRQLTPDGTCTEYTYYTGEHEDCPADRHGFVRYLKSQTVTPPKISHTEPIKTTKHTWTKLNALQGNGYAVVPKTIQKSIGKIKTLTKNSYHTDRSDRSLYGRLLGKEVTLTHQDTQRSFTSSKRFSYEIKNNECIETKQFTGHDGLTSIRKTSRHIRTAKVQSEITPNGLETTFSYDIFGRILRRTSCPGTRYETATTWEYDIYESGPCTVQTDEIGNKIKSTFDGLGRAHKRQWFDMESSKWYDTYSCDYNALGEVIVGTTKDYSRDSNDTFPLTCDIEYDDWGSKRTAAFSIGRKEQQYADPVNLKLTVYREGLGENGVLKSASKTTILDRKSKLPVNQLLKDIHGEEYSSHAFTWNGCGQLWKERDEVGNISETTYDDFGRVVQQKFADNTVVRQTYAAHLVGNQVTTISVTGKNAKGNEQTWLMGTQAFDSFGRLTRRNVGGRETLYAYEGASVVPSEVTLPSGKQVKYEYIPELGNAVKSVTVDNITKTFKYDKRTGKLLTARGTNSEIKNVWTASGLLKEEIFTSDGQRHLAKHIKTVKGAPVTYTDVTGKKMRYELDAHGRVTAMTNDSITVELVYDSLGRLIKQTTRHLSSSKLSTEANLGLTIEFQYDDYSREIKRTVRGGRHVDYIIEKRMIIVIIE